MPITLHAALVPGWLQILASMRGLLDKAETHCAKRDLPEHALVEARIIDDMFPFSFQIKSVAAHSLGAIEGVRAGVYTPDTTPPPRTLDGLRTLVDDAIDGLRRVTADEMEDFIGRPVRYELPLFHIQQDYWAEDFLLSFSQPNFHFHAATAYDILRSREIAIGKRDFLGRTRQRTPA